MRGKSFTACSLDGRICFFDDDSDALVYIDPESAQAEVVPIKVEGELSHGIYSEAKQQFLFLNNEGNDTEDEITKRKNMLRLTDSGRSYGKRRLCSSAWPANMRTAGRMSIRIKSYCLTIMGRSEQG